MITYNASSNAYEREGFEPVSKDYILGIVSPFLAEHNRSSTAIFVKKIYEGTYLLEAHTDAFLYNLADLMLGLLFLMSEKYPENPDQYASNCLFGHLKNWLLHCAWKDGVLINYKDRIVRWFFMLCKEEQWGEFAIGIITHIFSYSRHRYVPSLLSRGAFPWGIIFDFARVIVPENNRKLRKEMIRVMRGAPEDEHPHLKQAGIIIRDCRSYNLYKYSLFDRLWYHLSSEENEILFV